MSWAKRFAPLVFLLTAAVVGRAQGPTAGGYQPPAFTLQTPPRYPPTMKQQQVEGVVIVSFVANRFGRVENAIAVVAQNGTFAQAAVDAVGHWKFRPGTKDGVAVNALLMVPVVFALKPKSPVSSPAAGAEITALYVMILRDWAAAQRELSGQEASLGADGIRLVSAAIIVNPKGEVAVVKVGGEADPVMAAELQKSIARTLFHRSVSPALTACLAAVHGFKITVPVAGAVLAPSAEAAAP